MRSFKFKSVVVLLSLLWWIVPCLAQNPTITSRLDFKNQASAPSNPDEGVSSVYVTTAGVVRVRLSDGTDTALLTGSIDTDDVVEGSTNLYHTTSRVRAALSAGTNITYDPETGVISATGGGSGALSALTAATASNDINNANNAQIWRWNTLAGTTGLQLASSSTAAASNLQKLFELSLSGANANSSQTTYTADFSNTHTGTNSSNVALRLSASGASNNYALIIPNGNVGIGTSTPSVGLDMGAVLTGERLRIFNDGFTVMGLGVNSATLLIYSTKGTNGGISLGFRDSGSPFNYTEFWRLSNLGSMAITQGTVTTNQPYINHTVTVNQASTPFILDDSNMTDTASASSTLLLRKRVNSVDKFTVRKDGFGYFAGNIGANVNSPSVIINPFDSPNAGTIIQSAGFVSSQRTGQVGFHMFNGGGVAEWILTQPASGTSSNFQINKVVSNVQTKLFELTTDGDLKITEGGLSVKEGANKSMGVATLSSGTVTVNTTKVTANSRIFLTKQGSATKHGILVVSARTAGTSFTITSVDGADGTATQTGDDGQVAWQIVEPN